MLDTQKFTEKYLFGLNSFLGRVGGIYFFSFFGYLIFEFFDLMDFFLLVDQILYSSSREESKNIKKLSNL